MKRVCFLKEYCQVLKPLARGLDILQGENNCFYGTLLPTLETILKKVRAIKPEISLTSLGLAVCIEDSIKQCFSRVFAVADPGGFHWFPRKPPFKSEDYFNTYIYAAIKTYLKTYFVLLHNHS